MPKGGPDGGDGGRGGDVVLVCDPSRRDLSEFHRGAHFKAERGGHGEGSQRHGADAPPLRGARAARHGGRGRRARRALGPHCVPGQRAVVARGGAGGRGQQGASPTATRQTPRLAERGLPGRGGLARAAAQAAGRRRAGGAAQRRQELAARAPDRGAAPKVADYPFTTLEPVLGTIEADDAPAGGGRHPGPDRGRQRGRRPGPRVPRPRRALPAAGARARPGARSTASTRWPTTRRSRRSCASTGRGLAALPRMLVPVEGRPGAPEEAEAAVAEWRERLGDAGARGAGHLRGHRARVLDELRAALVRRRARAAPRTTRGRGEAEVAGHPPRLPARAPTTRFRVERTGRGAFRVSGERVERLLARHDLGNEEALRYLEERLRAMGVIRALEARLRARRRRGDRAARSSSSTPAPRCADPGRVPSLGRGDRRRQAGLEHRRRRRGEVRVDVARAGVRGGGRAPRRGRLGRAGHLGGDRPRDAADGAAGAPGGDGRAAGRLGGRAGAAVPGLRRAAARERGVPSAQVLLTFFDMSARTHYLNARHTLRKLLDWRVVPVINENDTTTTDEISFGDNDFLAAQVAILLGADRLVLLTDTDGLYTADPRPRPRRRAVAEVRVLRGARGPADRLLGLAARARAACARRWWPPRWPPRPASRRRSPAAPIPRRVAAALAGEPAGTRFHPQAGRVSSFKLWLKYAKPTPRRRSTVDDGRRAGAARARHQPAAGGDRGRGGRVRGRRRRGGAAAGDGRGPIGKGIVNYSAERAARRSRA